MNRIAFLIPAVTFAALPGCGGSGASDAPPLAATDTPVEQRRNWLENTGDAAWNAVASPINGLIPRPRPKPEQEPVELTPAGPAQMVIITRENRGVTIEGAATDPATQPTTQP